MSERMIFCLGDGRFARTGEGYQKNTRIFNVDVTEDEWEKTREALKIKNFKLPITTWVDTKDIEVPTDIQKQLGGYLKTLSYKDAWKEMWQGLSQEDKQFFLDLPHFNWGIFTEITGITPEDVSNTNLSDEELIKELEKRGRIFDGKVIK